MRFTIIIMIWMLFGCSKHKGQPDCQVDYEFKSYFFNSINLISIRQLGVYTDHNTSWSAYKCLKILTKHDSFMDVQSDSPLTYPYSDSVNYFCKDLENWLQWYEKSKCEITLARANTMLKTEDVSWPPFLEELQIQDLGCTTEVVESN
jgi:hypothetical protein